MGKNSSFSAHILSIFYRNPNNFISTMLVGNNIALVIYGIWMAQLIEKHLLGGFEINNALLVFIETILSTAIILVTGEFMPKTLFKINPNGILKVFASPGFICAMSSYSLSADLHRYCPEGILRLTGTKINKEATNKAFTKVEP